METIRERLARITTLTAEELAQLRADIVSEAERLDVDGATVEDIAALQQCADGGEALMAEEADRATKAAEAETARESARERISALNPEAAAEPDADTPAADADPAEPADDPPAVEPVAEETPAEPVAVAAAGGQVARMAARQTPPLPSPEAAAAPARNRAVLMASGALRGLRDQSAPIEDRMVLAEAMAETLRRMKRGGAPRGDVVLASATWEYPEDRQFGHDAWANAAKVDAATNLEVLTASGGICAPTNVDYTMPGWATTDRPIRGALPGFQASRGGILYVAPSAVGTFSAATGIWTEATDAAPGISTKPVVSIQCGSSVQVYVEAVSTRLGFGNMQARFAPEQVAALTDLAMADAARIQENNLLNLIAAACTAGVTTSTSLGATRDLLMALDQACAAYRQTHRIPRTQTMTAIFPDWVKDLLRIDLLREIGHDNSGARDVLALSDEDVVTLLRAHGVNPVFHIDGQPSGTSGGVNQTFAAQTASGPIKPFPTSMTWYLYAEGMFQFLDGGQLDLGVVRDSTLDSTNDFETFVEVFESVAFRGFTGGALQLVSSLCASGGSAGTQNTQSATSTTCP